MLARIQKIKMIIRNEDLSIPSEKFICFNLIITIFNKKVSEISNLIKLLEYMIFISMLGILMKVY